MHQMYAERPTYAVCSDATKPGTFCQAADSATRERESTKPDRLTFLMGASPEDRSAYENEKYDASQPERWWVEREIAAFQMATCCVTRAQYRLFDLHRDQANQEEKEPIAPEEDCPITHVDWFDSFCFALWVGEGYGLPTEEQWEGAAWGGIDRRARRDAVISVPPYHAGFTSNEVNYDGDYPIKGQAKSDFLGRTLPVRWDACRRKQSDMTQKPDAYQANGFGLWQVNGNVNEWCESGWGDGTLQGAIAALKDETQGVEREDVNGSSRRVLRGGSWFSPAKNSRSAFRFRYAPDFRDFIAGFRVLRTQ